MAEIIVVTPTITEISLDRMSGYGCAMAHDRTEDYIETTDGFFDKSEIPELIAWLHSIGEEK